MDCWSMQSGAGMHGMGWMMVGGGLLWLLLVVLAVLAIAALAKYLFVNPRADHPPPQAGGRGQGGLTAAPGLDAGLLGGACDNPTVAPGLPESANAPRTVRSSHSVLARHLCRATMEQATGRLPFCSFWRVQTHAA